MIKLSTKLFIILISLPLSSCIIAFERRSPLNMILSREDFMKFAEQRARGNIAIPSTDPIPAYTPSTPVITETPYGFLGNPKGFKQHAHRLAIGELRTVRDYLNYGYCRARYFIQSGKIGWEHAAAAIGYIGTAVAACYAVKKVYDIWQKKKKKRQAKQHAVQPQRVQQPLRVTQKPVITPLRSHGRSILRSPLGISRVMRKPQVAVRASTQRRPSPRIMLRNKRNK
jgi:hypothetical protein